jgi:hypothetical protein
LASGQNKKGRCKDGNQQTSEAQFTVEPERPGSQSLTGLAASSDPTWLSPSIVIEKGAEVRAKKGAAHSTQAENRNSSEKYPKL